MASPEGRAGTPLTRGRWVQAAKQQTSLLLQEVDAVGLANELRPLVQAYNESLGPLTR